MERKEKRVKRKVSSLEKVRVFLLLCFLFCRKLRRSWRIRSHPNYHPFKASSSYSFRSGVIRRKASSCSSLVNGFGYREHQIQTQVPMSLTFFHILQIRIWGQIPLKRRRMMRPWSACNLRLRIQDVWRWRFVMSEPRPKREHVVQHVKRVKQPRRAIECSWKTFSFSLLFELFYVIFIKILFK